jgi:hypothetical protein
MLSNQVIGVVIGLAMMALRLACGRIYGDPLMANAIVVDRSRATPRGTNACSEYFRIIDRIARGEAP